MILQVSSAHASPTSPVAALALPELIVTPAQVP